MVPRNFIFSGKGFTKNPANVESVIINKATFIPNDIAEVPVKIETVELSQKLNSINDKRVNKMDLEKLVAELKLEVETEKAKAVKADVLRAENDEKITKLQQTVADLTAADKVKDELAAKLKNDITELVAEKTKLEKTVADLQIEKLETDRVTTLVSAGLDKADATKFVKTFANVSDEQFAELVAIKVESSVKPKVEEMPKEGVAKTAPTPKPELELEASTTPHLSTDHTKTTHEVLSAAKGYFNSRKILGK
jgi:chromosome segregation ATPase